MKITFAHCNILNGNENMTVQEDMNIIVDRGKIVAIEKDKYEGTIINCASKFVCPGLINMHVHLSSDGISGHHVLERRIARLVNSNYVGRYFGLRLCQNFVYTQLMSGVTTLRCVGGLSNVDSTIRDKVNVGKLIGPRMIVANRAITIPHGYMMEHGPMIVENLEDCKEVLKRLLKTHPDFIKIMVTGSPSELNYKTIQMPADLIRYICNVAHRNDLNVAAHVETSDGLRVALENGVDIIEHGSFIDDELLTLYTRKGAKLVTTLSCTVPLAHFDATITSASNEIQNNAKEVLKGMIHNAKHCIHREIPVGLGNDAGRPFVTHYNFWRELVLFQKMMNVTPKYALYTATKRNAQLLGIDATTGTIEEGKFADFLILDNNPIEDLSALRTINTVVFNGRIFKNPTIKKNVHIERLLDSYMENL